MEVIKCVSCETFFPVLLTGKKSSNGAFERKYLNGRGCYNSRCYQCHRNRIRLNREKTAGYCKKYEKTKNGFIVRLYRNMKSRITGVQKTKRHLYEGKEILSKKNFYEWISKNREFDEIFKEYEKSGYKRRFAPSVDRIDSSVGYVIENMRIVPFHINCSNVKRN